MAKDKIIGACIMVVGILMAIVYTLGSIVDLYLSSGFAGALYNANGFELLPGMPDLFDWRLFVVAPLWLIVVLISVIAIWIGYSMLTGFQDFSESKLHACARSIRGIGRGARCGRSC